MLKEANADFQDLTVFEVIIIKIIITIYNTYLFAIFIN